MIELADFKRQRATITNDMAPHKMVRLDEIRQVDKEVFSVDDTDVIFSPRAQKKLMHAIGTNRTQLKSVRGLSGDEGQTNFSNYLTVAKNMEGSKNVVLMADRDEKIVTNIIVPKKDFIPVDDFFDFAELFIDSTSFEIESIQYSNFYEMDVVMYMQNRDPQIVKFAPDEEFISNGAYLHWDGVSIEVGSYYVRLVCTNGQTSQIRHRDARIFTIQEADVRRILAAATSDRVLMSGFEDFRQKVYDAMQTKVSLRELTGVHKFLTRGRLALPAEVVAPITMLEDNRRRFEARGVHMAGNEERIKTDVGWWELYNRLTAFATYNTIMEPHDIRRNTIASYAMTQLMKDHDIISYIE